MPKEKKSFFERLTGTVKLDEMDEETAEVENKGDAGVRREVLRAELGVASRWDWSCWKG